ncbi:LysM peptidoglycan-binding domain-containing protein [Agromyces archimandritae]|uniref:LysM peptidoglycan-binding domain-containing protein n=1 Tax=Agromyces archimandritae TaxID=2781962 RepID=A0A975FPK8_9MICO|nr:LysM domain-containing protein [Agromyces archimandritae]QTX05949.1 LysM peptidoglycan-binding domain-containing protein [Agromyces archimandritae]
MRPRRPPRPVHRSALGGALALLATGAAALVLAACTAPEAPPAVTETVVVTETAFVTVTAEPPPAPEPDPAEAADPEAPAPSPNDAAPVYEWGAAYDNGPRPGANGAPEVDETGEPERYSVVSGDSFFDIAQRFDLPQQQLLRMNPQIYDYGDTVYIGQLLNLDWQKTGVG